MIMKKIALCLALASVYGSAQAATLSILNLSSEFVVSGYNGQPAAITGAKTAGNFGTLVTDGKGTVAATYLGSESGYKDGFRFVLEGLELNEANSPGDSISKSVTGGTVAFQFFDSKGFTFNDGSASGPTLGFAFLKDGPGSGFGESNAYGDFQYLLGFNDSSRSDADYDDYVVGVNFASAVPLPAALPLMAS